MTNTLVIFEKIKKINEYHVEYWSARDLAKTLEYYNFRNFIPVIEKAKESCKNAGQSTKEHFADFSNMIEIGHSASRELDDVQLSRYACYLILQNADPSKEIVALGQTYFAIQTRKQEIQDQLIEDHSRIANRGDISVRNKHLAQTASRAGVDNFGIFTNYGYRGLYGGLDLERIHRKKKLKEDQKILDYMGSEELAANIFRVSQADAKLKRENIRGELKANQAHYEVGKKVRGLIKELGGTMPENLQATDSISAARKRLKKANKLTEIAGR